MRIYFDENFSPALIEGLRRIQEGRRSDDITVCSVIEEFGRGAPDETWVPGVASRHGVVITQDININRTRAQWELCRVNKIGVFFVRPPKKDGATGKSYSSLSGFGRRFQSSHAIRRDRSVSILNTTRRR